MELGADESSSPENGEVVFIDENGVVAARRWCWRQSATSAAIAETTDAFERDEIRQRIDVCFDETVTQAEKNQSQFSWDTVPTVEELARIRRSAMEKFLAHYQLGNPSYVRSAWSISSSKKTAFLGLSWLLASIPLGGGISESHHTFTNCRIPKKYALTCEWFASIQILFVNITRVAPLLKFD